ncbi:Hypothetical protein CINCED_3A010796 [Cinara cedri]|uniref:Uncharacterized protein n=1 Tax=Cinara cedri TaxID=506608 RepID=A0A5E4MVS8_9HEMI|nr:Hypothetical protein CINCED_3A010796 [Cinara cedri]
MRTQGREIKAQPKIRHRLQRRDNGTLYGQTRQLDKGALSSEPGTPYERASLSRRRRTRFTRISLRRSTPDGIPAITDRGKPRPATAERPNVQQQQQPAAIYGLAVNK